MTLVELLLAMMIMGLVASAAVSFVQQQQMAVFRGTGKMRLLQNYSFTADMLERTLRATGTGVPARQPVLVYADTSVIAFNADYATDDGKNPFAVYVAPGANREEVGALTPARSITLPGTGFTYPATGADYGDGGAPSPAETIVFFFRRDSTTARTDDFVLYRQVNDSRPEVVARDLLRSKDRPFFQYQKVAGAAGAERLDSVARAALPMTHAAPMHLAPGAAGEPALIDSVRTVRVNFVASNGAEGKRQLTREVSRLIRMPNVGVAMPRTCGDAPLAPTGISAAQTGPGQVRVSWSASADEDRGERDVVRYAIFRRRAAQTSWGEPYFSVPPGEGTYTDQTVLADSTYQYAVAAQDCTPSMSPLEASQGLKVNP